MMRRPSKVMFVVLFYFFSFTLITGKSNEEKSRKVKSIIPISNNYSFNKHWETKKISGKRFWYCIGASTVLAQVYDIERYGWHTRNETVNTKIGKALVENKSTIGDNPIENYFFRLFKGNKVPLKINFSQEGTWDAEKQIMVDKFMPSKKEFEILRGLPNFLGWAPATEWGNGLQVRVSGKKKSRSKYKELKEALYPNSPKTHKEFVEIAKNYWRGYNKAYNYEVEGHDGSYYWAIQWPAILGARNIITEARYGGRNNVGFHSFTRAAGRMGDIVWGFAPGSTFDVRWGLGQNHSSRGARATEQLNRGYSTYPLNLMRRLMYFWSMGGATIIGDETVYRSYDDPERDGTFRLNNYGHIIDEVTEFADSHPDIGTPYTPIGILLSWDNAFISPKYKTKSKAFGMIPCNIGEHMTVGIFDRVLNPIEGIGSWDKPMDLFGASPYGEIYDPLRIDTPKGVLPLELLKNYKVLFAVGKQNVDPSLVKHLKKYVQQGGTLILNVKQLKDGLSDEDFIGVKVDAKEQNSNQMLCQLDDKELVSGEFTYNALKVKGETFSLYNTPSGDVLVARHSYGKGYVITIAAHWLLENKTNKILPIAADIIGHLRDAVLPFKIRGDKVSERVLYLVNRKGDGWVLSLFNNAGREHNSRKPETVFPNYKVDLEIVMPQKMVDAVEWINRDRLTVESNNKRSIVKVELKPGEVKIIEIQPKEIPSMQVWEHVNLALNKSVKASTFCGLDNRNRDDANPTANNICKQGNIPELAVNGNKEWYDAWWSKKHADAQEVNHPWLEVDLGGVRKIRSINPIYMWSEDNNTLIRIYQYYVEASIDGKIWTKIIDETKNTTPAHRRGNHRYFVEKPIEARYVRITTTLATAHGGAQLVEFEVYGTDKILKTYKWKKNLDE